MSSKPDLTKKETAKAKKTSKRKITEDVLNEEKKKRKRKVSATVSDGEEGLSEEIIDVVITRSMSKH